MIKRTCTSFIFRYNIRYYNGIIKKCFSTTKAQDLSNSKLKLKSGVSPAEAQANPAEGEMQNLNGRNVLNVAEKNDAAKRIAGLLSSGTSNMRNGVSKFNKNYEFTYTLFNQQRKMVMTSVSGHLLAQDFTGLNRIWTGVEPVELFDAPIVTHCPDNFKDIKKNLEREAVYSDVLIIWTDCDREGENIGFEIISVCTAVNPRLDVYRAKFSEITPQAMNRAITTLGRLDKRISDAVEVRKELDLRIGAAFTRLQTLRLQRRFANVLSKNLISYGSCQFPTLGFVVERYKAIQDFIPETFWKIEVNYTSTDGSVDFQWSRVRLHNQNACLVLFEKCLDNPLAKVTKITNKPKSKWRPVAMDTIEFEKLASRKLKINAKEAMKIAEKLYTSGYISYPRTETNIFPQGLALGPLVEAQTNSNKWGEFATKVITWGPRPRNGKKSDQAHPPIHPTKAGHELTGNEGRIYELIVRHFLACCSKDALGHETIIEIEIAEEKFVGHGLLILERNYLEVYIYDKWSDKELPHLDEGQTFEPTKLEMTEGSTSPPNLLTEADLISLMEKHGIGTDATHAEHIETIKTRLYVGVQGDGRFLPGLLGMGLVEGYDSMGLEMSKPNLRAELEADLKRICDGTKDPNIVLGEQIDKYRDVFIKTSQLIKKLDDAIGKFINQNQNDGNNQDDNQDQGPDNAPRPPPPPPPNNGRNNNRRRDDDDNDNDDDGNDDLPPRPPRQPVKRNQSKNYQPPPPQPSQNRNNQTTTNFSTNYSSSNNRNVVQDQQSNEKKCLCGQIAIRLKVQKEGPNKGRFFFKCNDQQGCNFFEWDDNSSSSTNVHVNTQSNYNTPSTSRPPQPKKPWTNPNPMAPSQPQQYGSTDDGDPNCKCDVPAVNRTVSKDGPNKGRPFFTCVKGPGSGCGFFQWADVPSATTPTPTRSNSYQPPQRQQQQFNTNPNSGVETPNCQCNLPAASRIVSKEGANKGRHFFGCSKGLNGGCNFFQWSDKPAVDYSVNLHSNTQNRSFHQQVTTKARKFNNPRKCGICRETGHTRKNCPNEANEANENNQNYDEGEDGVDYGDF